MTDARIRTITSADDPAIAAIAPLFVAMHNEMAAQGMLLRLAPEGAAIWLKSVGAGLERFGRLAVAERDGTIIGFAHAAVKLAPEHLGGLRIGHISHVYVEPKHRRTGIARSLASNLHEWLRAKEVASIELQVVHGNIAGAAFWRALGYADELLQMRKQ